jgi:hypothetical protein
VNFELDWLPHGEEAEAKLSMLFRNVGRFPVEEEIPN